MSEFLEEYPMSLTISDVADILNITPATVRRHIQNKEIPAVKVGKLVRIPKDYFKAYLRGDKEYLRKENAI